MLLAKEVILVTCAVLVLLFLAMGVCGFRAMDRLDRFLKEHVGCEEDTDEPERKRAG